ncbi:hypothetical protein U1Q18_002558 [Sarracenia purpurea var. burkii]
MCRRQDMSKPTDILNGIIVLACCIFNVINSLLIFDIAGHALAAYAFVGNAFDGGLRWICLVLWKREMLANVWKCILMDYLSMPIMEYAANGFPMPMLLMNHAATLCS